MSNRKRSLFERTATANNKKICVESDVWKDASVFSELLNKSGYILKNGSSANILCVDQVIFQRNLTLSIKQLKNSLKVVEEFTEGFSTYIDNPSRLYQSVMPTIISEDCDSVRSTNQETLVRLLLNIDILQPSLAKILLEKLPEYTEDQSVFDNNEVIDLPKLIIYQFRWLDHIVNGENLCNKLLEILSVSSLDIQREIISAISEIIDDKEHSIVAEELRSLFIQNSDLTVCILDSLSNLNIKKEILLEIRSIALQKLPSVAIEHLPVLTKFILQSISSSDVHEVISEFRMNIDFSSTFIPSSNTLSQKSSSRNAETLTIDTIKSAIRFQKIIGDTWIKVIEEVHTASDHKIIDMLILLILHSLPNRKRPIESLIRNKIRAGSFSETLLQVTFESHKQIIHEQFSSVLCLAEILLHSSEPVISSFSSAIYRYSFAIFNTFCQQEVVASLVSHIGSGITHEVDSVIDTLHDIVIKDIKGIAPFAIFVKNVLDYLDQLTVTQIRKIFLILSIMAFKDSKNNASIEDDLHIIIRKQLTNNSLKYKRIGILGALMIIKCMAEKKRSGFVKEDASSSSVNTKIKSTLTKEVFQQVKSLYELVKSSSNKNPEIYALFLDELANILQQSKLDPGFQMWISENLLSEFQDNFVIDIDNNLQTEVDSVPLELSFCLDSDYAENGIAINIFPLFIKSLSEAPSQNKKKIGKAISPVVLASFFRLVQVVEKNQHKGDLGSIDALLGCPVLLCKDISENFKSFNFSQKKNILSSLFICINWFREVINAFASQKDAELKIKVITRLQNITFLEKIVEKCLFDYPKFIPPSAIFDCEESDYVTIVPTSISGKGKGKSSKKNCKIKVGKKSKTCSSQTHSPLSNLKSTKNDKIISDDDESGKGAVINISNYKQFLRELDMDVFIILKHNGLERTAIDSEENIKNITSVKINSQQLEFLMEDLTTKLEHSLMTSTNKRRIPFKCHINKKIGFSHLEAISVLEIATFAVNLLPALCYHLESVEEFFQNGLTDGQKMFSSEGLQQASCYHLLLQTMTHIFSWNGFKLDSNYSLLKKAVHILASRVSDNATQSTSDNLYKLSIQYLCNFSKSIPNFTVAVHLLKLLNALIDHSNNETLKTALEIVAQNILKSEWTNALGQPEKGTKFNDNLLLALQIYLENCSDILGTLEEISIKGMQELIDNNKGSVSTIYASLNKSTFSIYYRVIMNKLVSCMKVFGDNKPNDTNTIREKRLMQWSLAIRILQIMINLIKVFDHRVNLGVALKNGRNFVDLFLRLGMPLLDHIFKSRQEDILQMLKYLQLSTRLLHYMCSHTKVCKDVVLTKHVPLVKKTLELFVYRVKAMLALNNCQEAFWVGNLKNRNLQGEEISSQVPNDNLNPDEDIEDEMSEEESDVDLDDGTDVRRSKIHSEEEESLSEPF